MPPARDALLKSSGTKADRYGGNVAMPRVSIDGREVDVTPGSNLLAALRKLEIDVPALCYLPGCTPNTACMACVVWLKGPDRIVPSCATRAEERMCIESETPELHELRRMALELMLSDHAGARWGEPETDGRRRILCDCGPHAQCRLRKYAELYGADPERYRPPIAGNNERAAATQHAPADLCVPPIPADRMLSPPSNPKSKIQNPESTAGDPRYDHPEIEYHPALCIRCGICVQLSRQAGEPLGLTFIGRGFDTRVDVPFGDCLSDALRTPARRCAGACPTGALRPRDRTS